MNRPEIIAPWWSWTKAMVAAINWAEAVYLGVPFTSLRMRQNKIRTFAGLKKAIDDLHNLGVKAYLTMNIFPRNVDIKLFESIVEQISSLKPDAIIFSDPGTYRILKKYLPDIKLHLSTQTNTLNYEAVAFWRDLGVKRIVLARELNIKEIEEIKKRVPDMELEIFVHWAMCMTYSGRCLLGEYFAWRDWNKWECSHVCRYKFKVYLEEENRPWKLFQLLEDEEWSYLLSSKDLNTIERLNEILPIVDWLKIEWRSKSERYAAATVKAYRHVRDSLLAWKNIDESIKNLVYEIPHRYYWEWFLFNDIRYAPDSMERPEDYDLTKVDIEKKSIKEINESLGENIDDSKLDFEPGLNISSITQDTAGPVAIYEYKFLILPEYINVNGKKYFKVVPKSVINRWDIVKIIAKNWIWESKVVDFVDRNGNFVDKLDPNKINYYILLDKDLEWFEVGYWKIN